MSNGMGMMIETLVAILLMFTIGYCMKLNRRLKVLKADEHALRATIAELVTATDMAERAIAGLKITARECDIGLGDRLIRGEGLCADLDRRLVVAKQVLEYLPASRAATAAAPAPRGDEATQPVLPLPPAPSAAPLSPLKPPVADPQAIAAAAQAFAERLRAKVYGFAA